MLILNGYPMSDEVRCVDCRGYGCEVCEWEGTVFYWQNVTYDWGCDSC